MFSAALCLGATALGLYEAYTDLRDAFCPAKSRLAKSIRSRFPSPTEAPPGRRSSTIHSSTIRVDCRRFPVTRTLTSSREKTPRMRGMEETSSPRTHSLRNGTSAAAGTSAWPGRRSGSGCGTGAFTSLFNISQHAA